MVYAYMVFFPTFHFKMQPSTVNCCKHICSLLHLKRVAFCLLFVKYSCLMSANVLCTSKYIIYISAAIFCLDFLYGERQSAAFICSVLRNKSADFFCPVLHGKYCSRQRFVVTWIINRQLCSLPGSPKERKSFFFFRSNQSSVFCCCCPVLHGEYVGSFALFCST